MADIAPVRTALETDLQGLAALAEATEGMAPALEAALALIDQLPAVGGGEVDPLPAQREEGQREDPQQPRPGLHDVQVQLHHVRIQLLVEAIVMELVVLPLPGLGLEHVGPVEPAPPAGGEGGARQGRRQLRDPVIATWSP